MRHTLHRSAGFTYITVIVMVVIMGIMLGAVGQVWKTVMQRDREEELLFRGLMYKRAITQWYTPAASTKQPLPLTKLEDLVKDPTSLEKKRYLPRLYADPMTGKEWGVVKDQTGGIIGVVSTSTDDAFKTTKFPEELKELEGKKKYSEWQFVYTKQQTQPGTGGSGSTGGGNTGDGNPRPPGF
jgi:type II secretory pathway pseudopilin PulG